MRLHVVSLPHTQTTGKFSSCAYTNKVMGFCRMMMGKGHEVFLYSGEQNNVVCTEHVPCITEHERMTALFAQGMPHYTAASFDWNLPHWKVFNNNVVSSIRERIQDHDIICVIAGLAHKPIADKFPNHITVEFGVGYGGTFSKFKVYESYAWMHTSYGSRKPHDPHAVDGNWFDAVIPGYLDHNEFPYRGANRRGNDYYLYVGRMIERKGINIAIDVCRRAGKRLVMAGPGDPPSISVDFVGEVGPEKRGELMAGATALIMPTVYIEPFGNVAIEAMACGTPVICTDWGAMTETVIDGVTGFRCHILQEFIDALEDVKELNPVEIRRHVVKKYSLGVVAEKYDRYLKRLLTMYGKGWYETAGDEDNAEIVTDCDFPVLVFGREFDAGSTRRKGSGTEKSLRLQDDIGAPTGSKDPVRAPE